MIEQLSTWVTDHGALVGFIAGGIAILEFTLKPFRSFYGLFKKPDIVKLDTETVERLIAKPPEDRQKMHVADFIAMRRELKEDLQKELAEAHDGEKTVLTAKIAELESQLANPEKAFAEMQTCIAELEALLERSGNDIGGDRLAEARTALEAGDFSIADTLFAEIEERRALEVQEAARAAFGRGEIAEEEIRWADAARHYARATNLDEPFEALHKTTHFKQLAGEFQEAGYFAGLCVALARAGNDKTALSKALDCHATVYWRLGQNDKAEPLLREALEIDAQTIGTSHPDYASHLNNFAGVVEAQGRYAEAEGLYREALKIGAQTIGSSHPDYANCLNNLAGVVKAQGRYGEAEGLYREALKIDAQTIGTGHPDYAIHLNNLAHVVEAQGRYAEAEGLYREALEIDAQTIGTGHPDYASHLNNLAHVVQAQGRYGEAEGLYREAQKIDAQTIGTRHPTYAKHLNNLAHVVKAQGRYAEAEGLYREALEIGAQTIGTSHPSYAIRLNNLASVLVKLDRGGEARAMFEQALDIFRATLPPEHPNIAIVEKHIANLPAP